MSRSLLHEHDNTLDFAQQIHIPSIPMQPAGPIYFKTPCKCRIFGVMCEAIPWQVNYWLMKLVTFVKGQTPWSVSYITIFQNHRPGETRVHVHLHTDNCSGQNKNNYFILYLARRTILQLHKYFNYSFLIAGHTKFSPNHCFRII